MKLSGAAAAASAVVAIVVEVAVRFKRSVSQDLTLSSLAISEGILP